MCRRDENAKVDDWSDQKKQNKKYIRGSIGVSLMVIKKREIRLRWFGHFLCWEESKAKSVKLVMEM